MAQRSIKKAHEGDWTSTMRAEQTERNRVITLLRLKLVKAMADKNTNDEHYYRFMLQDMGVDR